MRQHCAQCLSEVFRNGRQAPSGELLCSSCYAALWGPGATDTLREMVQRHSGRPHNGNGRSMNGHRANGRQAVPAAR